MEDDQKRLILALVLSVLFLTLYSVFIAGPMQEEQAELRKEAEIAKIEQGKIDAQAREDVAIFSTGQRISINTPSLTGSFSVRGSRFDDLQLKNYDKSLDDGSPLLTLLSKEGGEKSAYIFDNWTRLGGGNGANAEWAVVSGTALTPTSPVTLRHDAADFTVKRVISIDEHYLITLTDTVTNESAGDLEVVRRAAARQHELPDDLTNFFILQEGPIAVINAQLWDMKYKALTKKRKKSEKEKTGAGGWAGLTDKYWLSAAIAPQGQQITAKFDFRNLNGQGVYEAGYDTEPMTISAGRSIQSVGHIFAGAKEKELLAQYEKDHNIAQLNRAIDYGLLGLLTRPMSWALTKLGGLTGNFGVGILLLTLILKVILFPLNNKAYSSMAKMKKVAPKQKKLQERYKEDPMKLRTEMMALYRKEGVNPAAGCLPMIPQMFIFFALYKSLFITIEMRHAPFFGYIKDLSARDPLSWMNGFGLLPWDAVPIAFLSFIAIGPLALMYGISMAAMQTLNTPPADKMQARIFQLMPIFFMFILAPFAAGLLVYWVWNNILSLIQQYYITRKFKVDTPLDTFIAKLRGKKDAGGAAS